MRTKEEMRELLKIDPFRTIRAIIPDATDEELYTIYEQFTSSSEWEKQNRDNYIVDKILLGDQMVYKATHRILNKATETNFEYEIVEIDINSGLYKVKQIKASETKIRVKKEVYGENINGSSLNIESIKELQKTFNDLRATKDWDAFNFRDLNEKV